MKIDEDFINKTMRETVTYVINIADEAQAPFIAGYIEQIDDRIKPSDHYVKEWAIIRAHLVEIGKEAKYFG